VIAVARQDPPVVAGDGVRPLRLLLEAFNERIRRRGHPAYGPIMLDARLRAALQTHGIGPDTVLASDHRVVLAAPQALTAEDRWVDVTETLHPSHATRVAALCNGFAELEIAGVDVIIGDPGAMAWPGNHWLLEINSSPDICDHQQPWSGVPRDVAGLLIRHLLGHAE
jgi:D-alanine-D-alanine ligase-like ATP-grasp enzyme